MNILNKITKEYERSKKIYPSWSEDLVHAASIVVKEAGEVLRQAHLYHQGDEKYKEKMTQSATQAGAVIIRFLENIMG